MTPTPPRAAVPAQPDALSYEQVCDILETGNPTDEECRLIRLGYGAALAAAQGAAERAVPADEGPAWHKLTDLLDALEEETRCVQYNGWHRHRAPADIRKELGSEIKNLLAAAPAIPAPHGQAPAGAVQEREMEEALRERDDAEDFIDTLLDEVLGADRAEWSNTYGRPEALEEVRERMTALHKPAVDRAWARFETATQQVGASVTVSVGSQEFDLAETGAHFTTADMATACGQAFREGQATPTAQATPAAPSQQESNMAAPAQDGEPDLDRLLDELSEHDDPCEEADDALARIRALRAEIDHLRPFFLRAQAQEEAEADRMAAEYWADQARSTCPRCKEIKGLPLTAPNPHTMHCMGCGHDWTPSDTGATK